MTGLDDMLVGLADALADGGSVERADTRVVVTALRLQLPIECRIGKGGALAASLPRGRMQTGFGLPLGQLGARFECEEAA